ncbi:uncharacterized protein LOC144716005 [Wolffia australiana]
MDYLISTALEEICAEGAEGIPLPKLWANLQNLVGLHVDQVIKDSIWARVLGIPDLFFRTPKSGLLSRIDLEGKSVDQAEKMGLRVVAGEHVRDGFLGISEMKASNVEITPVLKQVLERLAVARGNGIAQSQLSKEFKMKENTLFYYLKRLESQGLIVRQATILRTEGDESKDTAIVNTNLIFLRRYAKQLGSLQRIEITTPNSDPGNLIGVNDGIDGEESVKEGVNVKDFLPEMSAICEMLDESPGKILVVSDIKVARGYRMSVGHRLWRNICNRMKEALLVEEFMGKVNGKVVKCLRLLKKFNPKDFQPKGSSCGYEGPAQKCCKRGQITDQFVELPLEHRIYDIIDGEGPKGITIPEVSKRLGLSSKKTETRICDMCWRMPKRFPMYMRFENQNRTKVYRVWTCRNFAGNSSDGTPSYTENKIMASDAIKADLLPCRSPSQHLESALSNVFSSDSVMDTSNMYAERETQSQDILDTDAYHDINVMEGSILASETPHSLRKHSTAVTVDAVQREDRILGRLKSEKFLLTAELHKWLEGLEKNKQTTMARKTLTRSLQKLQQEGYCKCIQISVPVLANCNRTRAAEVILHPSIVILSSELLGQIHKRLREFDMQNRGQGLDKQKGDVGVSELSNVKRSTNNREVTESQSVKVETMRVNGYVPAIMVRAKLLHIFLWSSVRGLPGWDDCLMVDRDMNDSTSSCSVLMSFSLALTLENMPLELFLQVVGSEKRFEDLIEKCKRGLRLCDLPPREFKVLMNTHASGRLSRVIDILYRSKLVQLSTEGMVANTKRTPLFLSTYSLELKPFIEVPRSSSATDASTPRLRHDFLLTNKEAVDSYWQTLEYCHVSADRSSISKSFPGSVVKELFLSRSWASVRLMTAEQNAKLSHRLAAFAPDKKVPFVECVKISKELDLTLEQVLRASYGLKQGRRRRFLRCSNVGVQKEITDEILTLGSVSHKRKRAKNLEPARRVHANGQTEDTGSSRTSMITCDEETTYNVCYIDSQSLDGDNEKGLLVKDSSLRRPSQSRNRSKLQKRFHWSYQLDRRLVVEYVKYRAPFGAKLCRVDWTSISDDLPADPDTCKRRMCALNSDKMIRKKVMKLCNLVSSRYAMFLLKSRDGEGETEQLEKWDDFDDPEVKRAVDEVLSSKGTGNLRKHKKNAFFADSMDSDLPVHISSGENESVPDCVRTSLSSHCAGFPIQYYTYVRDSLSIANAVELFKLIFLSTSTVPEVRSLLAETLNRYSEADLTMAFNYLKEMKLMEHGHGKHQLILSQRFLINACSSPFPLDSGKGAAKISEWLRDQDKNLDYDGVCLNLDLQCGEIFQLLALLSSGRLSINPCIPEEGVGEPEDPKNSILEDFDGTASSDEKTAKQKTWWRKETDPCNRREKGFPGIQLVLQRKELSTADILSSRAEKTCQAEGKELLVSDSLSDLTIDCLSSSPDDSNWESMASYASRLNSKTSCSGKEDYVPPKLIKDVYSAVHQAGEQGLRKEELTKNTIVLDDELVEVTVDTLAEFQLVMKVNAYDHVRVVDSSYKSKYFIVTLEENLQESVVENSQPTNCDISRMLLKNPDDGKQPNIGALLSSGEGSMDTRSKGTVGKKIQFLGHGTTRRCRAILPWINGDGSTNDTVYKGLVRRILGIVMQSPGILEEDLMNRMNVLNRQSCRQLLDIMILNDHIIMKKMLQTSGCAPPSILGAIFCGKQKSEESVVFRKHYFANPLSASSL